MQVEKALLRYTFAVFVTGFVLILVNLDSNFSKYSVYISVNGVLTQEVSNAKEGTKTAKGYNNGSDDFGIGKKMGRKEAPFTNKISLHNATGQTRLIVEIVNVSSNLNRNIAINVNTTVMETGGPDKHANVAEVMSDNKTAETSKPASIQKDLETYLIKQKGLNQPERLDSTKLLGIVTRNFQNKTIPLRNEDNLHHMTKSSATENTHVPKKGVFEVSRLSIPNKRSPFNLQQLQMIRNKNNMLQNRIQGRGASAVTVRDARCENCFAHNFKYIVNNDNVCKTKSSKNDTVFLVILILTEPRNFVARMALRSTWLTFTNQNAGNIRHVFLLGMTENQTQQDQIFEENRKYSDIVQENFVDSYVNLTYKTIMGFKWVVEFCSNAKYVLKTDDDMFINVPHFVDYLSKFGQNLKTNIAGSCGFSDSPNRNSKSKWYASVATYKESRYPAFCSGTAYITSMDLVEKIYNVTSNVPFFHLEDVYIGLCMRQIGASVISLPGFNRRRVPIDACIYKGDTLFTSHMLTPDLLQYVWKSKCVANNKKRNL